MTLFNQLVARAARWIEDIDRERDQRARELSWELTTPVEKAFLEARLGYLEGERQQAVAHLEQLQALQHNPMAMFSKRPQHRIQLKVPLRRPQERKRA